MHTRLFLCASAWARYITFAPRIFWGGPKWAGVYAAFGFLRPGIPVENERIQLNLVNITSPRRAAGGPFFWGTIPSQILAALKSSPSPPAVGGEGRGEEGLHDYVLRHERAR